MLTITLRLSESLLCIFRDSGKPRPETMDIRVEQGTTVREILVNQGINPLLVPMAALAEDGKNRRVDLATPVTADGTLILYGPLAGG